MDDANTAQRLSQITTHWSLLARAHQAAGEDAAAARLALLERYRGAIYRYLLAAVQDPNVVDELCQEYALRFVRGDFRRADPRRGRFRDYVKTVLLNLINDFRRQHFRVRAVPWDSRILLEATQQDPEQEFLRLWREEILERAWEALAAAQTADGPPYYAVLRRRAEDPKRKAAEIADELSRKTGRAFTADAVRQTLHRARLRFGDLLLAEVARSLDAATEAELEDELHHLGLFAYCKEALERRNGGA